MLFISWINTLFITWFLLRWVDVTMYWVFCNTDFLLSFPLVQKKISMEDTHISARLIKMKWHDLKQTLFILFWYAYRADIHWRFICDVIRRWTITNPASYIEWKWSDITASLCLFILSKSGEVLKRIKWYSFISLKLVCYTKTLFFSCIKSNYISMLYTRFISFVIIPFFLDGHVEIGFSPLSTDFQEVRKIFGISCSPNGTYVIVATW